MVNHVCVTQTGKMWSFSKPNKITSRRLNLQERQNKEMLSFNISGVCRNVQWATFSLPIVLAAEKRCCQNQKREQDWNVKMTLFSFWGSFNFELCCFFWVQSRTMSFSLAVLLQSGKTIKCILKNKPHKYFNIPFCTYTEPNPASNIPNSDFLWRKQFLKLSAALRVNTHTCTHTDPQTVSNKLLSIAPLQLHDICN